MTVRCGEGVRPLCGRAAEAEALGEFLRALVLPRRALTLSDSDVVGAALPLVDETSNDVVSLVILIYQSRTQNTVLITSKQSKTFAVLTRRSGDLYNLVGSERARVADRSYDLKQ